MLNQQANLDASSTVDGRPLYRSSDNLVGSWIEIESSTEEEDSDAEVLE